MYFPYLRGKQFELEALRDVNPIVYQNTRPIVEPVTLTRRNNYVRLANQNVPFILITNPYHPINDRLAANSIQNLITTELAPSTAMILGFLIDLRPVNIADLTTFLATHPNRQKALIFRHSPLSNAILTSIQALITANPVLYLIFDEDKTNALLRNTFISYANRVLITDGFQHEISNALYPAASNFGSIYQTWQTAGWVGIGDYLTIGDYFSTTGGQAMVVTLHITKETPNGIVSHHFSSITNSSTRGFVAQKFAEANNLLVNSPHITPLNSSGLNLYRTWYTTSHNPQPGAAKKASIMHHIELMSSII